MSIALFKKIVIFSGLLSAVLSFNHTPNFYLLPLIPFTFGVLYYLTIPKNAYCGAGVTMLSLVLYVRYIIYPVTLISSNFVINGDEELATKAILLMLYEIIFIFITLRLSIHRVNNSGNSVELSKVSSIIPLICTIILIYVLMVDPQVFANRRWIWQTDLITAEKVEVNAILLELSKWAEFFVLIYVFYQLYKKYLHTRGVGYYYLSLIVLFIPCLTYTGHSRLSLLIPLITFMFFISKVYQDKSKPVVRFVVIYSFVSMILLTLQKSFGISSLSAADVTIQDNMLNAYFGGVDNVIIGIEAYHNYGSSPFYMIVDSFRNMMGVSQYFSTLPNTLDNFNMAFYAHSIGFSTDQIPPTITQGLMYFGPIFCFVPTVIMTMSVCVADKIFYCTKDLQVAYLCLGFCVAVAWAIPGSYMHFTTRLFNYVLPLLILVLINKFIKVKL